jgi:hypothetical protein
MGQGGVNGRRAPARETLTKKQPHGIRHAETGRKHRTRACGDPVVVIGTNKIGRIGPNFTTDTSSACNESALVIWCCPIMEMEQ